MYFFCKTVEAAIVCLWLLLQNQLRKNPRIALVFEAGCLLLTGSDLCSKGETWSGNDCNPPKRVSPRAACPKFQQHIRASVWSATLWTRLLPRAPLLPTATRGNTQDPPWWAQGWVTAPLSSQSHCPLSVLSVPAHPGENRAGGRVGISAPKHSVCYERPFFACAFYTTGYEMPPPLLSWIGNNWGICW